MNPFSNASVFADAAVGEGMQYELRRAWGWDIWIIVLVLLAAIALIVTVYLRERGTSRVGTRLTLATVRGVLIVMAAIMMLGWLLHRDRTDLPDLVIVIDDSESMQLADRYDDGKLLQRLTQRVQAVDLSEPTRINLAKTVLLEDDAKLLTAFQARYNVRIYRVGRAARPHSTAGQPAARSILNIAADEPESRLGRGLRDVFESQRGRPTAAVIVLTDGITTEGKTLGEVAPYARRKAIPLYLVALGDEISPQDIRLSDLLVDDVVFVNNAVHFDVKLSASGFAGEQAEVVLKEKGKPDVLARKQVQIERDDRSQTVRITYRPTRVGTFDYVVEVPPRESESNVNNNRVSRRIEVRDETIRVLLVQSSPSLEFRYLHNLLGRQVKQKQTGQEQTIELTTVWQQADQGFVDANPSVHRVFPVSREELFQYDVILFGDVDPADLGRLEMGNVADFVKVRGGGVVFIAGPRFTPLAYRETPLAELFPIDLASAVLPAGRDDLTESFRVRPTQLGMASAHMQLGDTPAESAKIWRQLEGVFWLLEAPDLRSAARVLAEHPTRTGATGRPLPVICFQFVGAGTVVFHATDETHRWRFRVGDKYFSRYWIQTIRYLARSKLLGKSRQAQLTSERREYRRGETVQVRARFFDERLAPAQDDGVTIVLEREQGDRRHVKLRRDAANRGTFEATLTNLAEGEFRGWLATPKLDGKPPSLNFTVVAPPGERARQEMDAADLQLAARLSQGKYYTIHNADRLLGDLPPGRQERIGSLPPLSIWSWRPIENGLLKNVPVIGLAFGLLFLVLIVTEWLLRKKVGML